MSSFHHCAGCLSHFIATTQHIHLARVTLTTASPRKMNISQNESRETHLGVLSSINLAQTLTLVCGPAICGISAQTQMYLPFHSAPKTMMVLYSPGMCTEVAQMHCVVSLPIHSPPLLSVESKIQLCSSIGGK